MTTQVGYGKYDVVGSPFDFYTNAPLGGVTGTLATGQSLQMNNNKIVFWIITGALAAETVVLPQNPVDGATAEISNGTGSQAITAITVSPATSYPGSSSTGTQNQTVSDSIVGTALSGGSSLAAATTLRYQYTLNGDVTKGAGPRSWVRVA